MQMQNVSPKTVQILNLGPARLGELWIPVLEEQGSKPRWQSKETGNMIKFYSLDGGKDSQHFLGFG